MKSDSESKSKFPQRWNPWLIILLTAPIPVALAIYALVKWYDQNTDYTRIHEYFIQRQNAVLAHNAVEVATGFSDLLEKASRDVQLISLLPPTADNLEKFYRVQMGDFTRFDTKNSAVLQEDLPFYNRLAILDTSANTQLEIIEGKLITTKKSFETCHERELCDRELYERAKQFKEGEYEYGKILRYYSPEGKEEEFFGAGLSIAFRGPKNIFVLQIDYRHLKDHMTTPTFPYEPKKDLLQAYQKGNYIYIVDSEKNIITHPRYWNVIGIDKSTGQWVAPMKSDSEMGSHPINIAAYQTGKLKEYFDRLLKNSFTRNSVDIFKAPNLIGNIRVLSVAPVLLSKGQYKKTGTFGHVIIGCSVDYFEEPKERVVPYY